MQGDSNCGLLDSKARVFPPGTSLTPDLEPDLLMEFSDLRAEGQGEPWKQTDSSPGEGDGVVPGGGSQ